MDAAEWKLEVERVLPMLKVHIRSDNKVRLRFKGHWQQKLSLSDLKIHMLIKTW